MEKYIKQHWFVSLLTVLTWLVVGFYLGFNAFFIVIVLTLLELTLSIDNAVVNSKILLTMSRLWQKLFITVGIFIAVFVVRFLLPIAIVAFSSSIEFIKVFSLALYDSVTYGQILHAASSYINAFGGTFLLLVALYFFIDGSRAPAKLWLQPIELWLRRLGRTVWAKPLILTLFALMSFQFVDFKTKLAIWLAIALYFAVFSLIWLIQKLHSKNSEAKKTGWAAFVAFVYLQLLDASFSLDGVVGAFALSSNIFIIMAGLGIGALWVRTLTIDLVQQKTLTHFRFLESGAYWAIFLLGCLMYVRLFHISFPDWSVGIVGLLCISAALFASMRKHIETK